MSWDISDVLAAKLASIVVHADELLDKPVYNIVNATQLALLIKSKEVQDFLVEVGPLAPVRRL